MHSLDVHLRLYVPVVFFIIFYPVVLQLSYQQFWFFSFLLIQFSVLHLLEEVSFTPFVLSHLS